MHRRHPVAKHALRLRGFDRAKSKRTPRATVHRTRSRAIELKAVSPLSSRNETSASIRYRSRDQPPFPSRGRNHRGRGTASSSTSTGTTRMLSIPDSSSSRRRRGRRRSSGYRTVTRRRAAERGHARARASILIGARRRGASTRVQLTASSTTSRSPSGRVDPSGPRDSRLTSLDVRLTRGR